MRKLQRDGGTETAAALQMEKTLHREAALEQDNSQWTGENRMLEPEEILMPNAAEMEWLNRQHHTSSLFASRTNDLIQIRQ
jgi:hypothetical protein